MSEQIVPVSALLLKLKNVISQNVILDHVWIEGEISNLTKHRSGHYYFSIKDAHSEMSCVMFASNVNRLRFSVEEGMKVLIKGSVNIYEQRGSLQLYVRAMRPQGVGELYLEFEQRKRILAEMGYFDESRKKTQPLWIMDIGVITAKDGAALQDVLITIRKRWPMMKITLYPALVQGPNAPKTLIQALRRADQKGHDALLLVRGGGSFEDLFCFNDVDLVKTISSLQTFLVAGIGHEVDTTLAELAADIRVATPTYAAQRVSKDQYEMMGNLVAIRQWIKEKTGQKIQQYRTTLNTYKRNPYFHDPLTWVIEKQMRLDALTNALAHNVRIRYTNDQSSLSNLEQKLFVNVPTKTIELEKQNLALSKKQLIENTKRINELKREQLMRQSALLDACSPLKILSRGYALVSDNQNSLIKSIKEITQNEVIRVHLSDGSFEARVLEKEEDNG